MPKKVQRRINADELMRDIEASASRSEEAIMKRGHKVKLHQNRGESNGEYLQRIIAKENSPEWQEQEAERERRKLQSTVADEKRRAAENAARQVRQRMAERTVL